MSAVTPTLRSNFRHLYADIGWYGVLSGSTLAFLNIYAARLGASAFAIGLLTAGPGVVNLLFSIPAGRWLEGRSFIRVSFWTSLVQRLGFVAMIGLPWLFADRLQVGALVGVTVLMSIPATLLSISFNALLAEVVPAEHRAEVVGRRNAVLAISMTLSTLVCGEILDLVTFPWNYQLVFGMGAVGAMLSTYHLGRLRASGVAPLASDPTLAPAGARRGFSLLHSDLLRGAYGRFMLAYLLFYTFQYLCLPLFPLAFVDTLHLSDSMIGLGNGLFYGAMFLVSLRLSRMARRYGQHRLLYLSAMGLALYPVLIGLAQGVMLYLIASLVGGIVWAVLSASLVNRLIERVPEDNRPAGMAFHNLALNLGILIGSLLGPALGDWIGLGPAILLGAGLRLLAGCLLVWWG